MGFRRFVEFLVSEDPEHIRNFVRVNNEQKSEIKILALKLLDDQYQQAFEEAVNSILNAILKVNHSLTSSQVMWATSKVKDEYLRAQLEREYRLETKRPLPAQPTKQPGVVRHNTDASGVGIDDAELHKWMQTASKVWGPKPEK